LTGSSELAVSAHAQLQYSYGPFNEYENHQMLSRLYEMIAAEIDCDGSFYTGSTTKDISPHRH